MSTIESILIPTDDSPGALVGARHGIALATRTGAAIHVLSVVDDAPEIAREDDEARAASAVVTIEREAKAFDDTVDVTTVVTHGTPFQTIREYASRRGIDMIAMGSKGLTGLERFHLGSVAENVLRTARVPVLVVPTEAAVDDIASIAFDRLLIPTDGSDGANIAAQWGVALASELASTVHVLHSVDTSRIRGPQDADEIADALTPRGDAAVNEVRKLATAVDVAIAATLTAGVPAEVILRYATTNDIDLIVMGTHGRTGIGQWFLGSVTENVVRQGDTPVLCVPVSAEAPRGR